MANKFEAYAETPCISRGALYQWDASDDWHTTRASNDLKVGGKLLLRIEANDGGMGFDFAATYTQVELNRLIEFRDDDGRVVRLDFVETDKGVTIRQTRLTKRRRLDFLLGGFGWCRMPEHLITAHLAEGRLVPLELAPELQNTPSALRSMPRTCRNVL